MQVQVTSNPLSEETSYDTYHKLTALAQQIESIVREINSPLFEKLVEAKSSTFPATLNESSHDFALGHFVAEVDRKSRPVNRFCPEVTFSIENSPGWAGRTVVIKEGDSTMRIRYQLEEGRSSIAITEGDDRVYWMRMREGKLQDQNYIINDDKRTVLRETKPAVAIEVAGKMLEMLGEGLSALKGQSPPPVKPHSKAALALKVQDFAAL